MNELVEMTEEQAARTVRRVGAQRALRAAPDVVGFARARIAGTFVGERGVEVPEDRTPLHAGWTDSADAAYAQLLDWVEVWAGCLGRPLPEVPKPWLRWREDLGEHEVLGFRADVAPDIAAKLTRRATRWLSEAMPAMDGFDSEDLFLTDVQRIVWSLQATVGMSRSERPPASPRPCPVCGELEVRGEFWGESMTAAEVRGDRWMRTRGHDFQDAFLAHLGRVTVRCSHCGYEVMATEKEKLQWLR